MSPGVLIFGLISFVGGRSSLLALFQKTGTCPERCPSLPHTLIEGAEIPRQLPSLTIWFSGRIFDEAQGLLPSRKFDIPED